MLCHLEDTGIFANMCIILKLQVIFHHDNPPLTIIINIDNDYVTVSIVDHLAKEDHNRQILIYSSTMNNNLSIQSLLCVQYFYFPDSLN